MGILRNAKPQLTIMDSLRGSPTGSILRRIEKNWAGDDAAPALAACGGARLLATTQLKRSGRTADRRSARSQAGSVRRDMEQMILEAVNRLGSERSYIRSSWSLNMLLSAECASTRSLSTFFR